MGEGTCWWTSPMVESVSVSLRVYPKYLMQHLVALFLAERMHRRNVHRQRRRSRLPWLWGSAVTEQLGVDHLVFRRRTGMRGTTAEWQFWCIHVPCITITSILKPRGSGGSTTLLDQRTKGHIRDASTNTRPFRLELPAENDRLDTMNETTLRVETRGSGREEDQVRQLFGTTSSHLRTDTT